MIVLDTNVLSALMTPGRYRRRDSSDKPVYQRRHCASDVLPDGRVPDG